MQDIDKYYYLLAFVNLFVFPGPVSGKSGLPDDSVSYARYARVGKVPIWQGLAPHPG